MKKVLSLFLAVLMVASIVAMMPVFTVSAAELDTSGLTEIKGTVGVGTGCGFIDGNATPNDLATYGMSIIMGTSDDTEILSRIKVYVDGVEVRLNQSYQGYTHSRRVEDDHLAFGVVGAGFTKDQEANLTFVFDNKYYMEGTFTPTVSTYAVESSHTIYYENDKTVVSVITFVDNVPLKKDDSLKLRFHDDHTERNATVTSVDGKTVTIKATDVVTDKTLCEYKTNDDKWFTMPIDEKAVTEKATGYIQYRPNADFSKFDTRIIVEATEEYVLNYAKAGLTITFTLADDTTKVYKHSTTQVFRKITANGEDYTPAGGNVMFGVAVTGIPKGVKTVAATITFSQDGVNVSEQFDLGSASLATIKDSVSAMKENMEEYSNTKITLQKYTDGNDLTANATEGPYYLFDGTVKKHGTHESNFSIEFTTEKPIEVAGIIFTTANDSCSDNRFYTSWTLYGSKDNGETFTEIARSDIPVNKGDKNYNVDDYKSLAAVPDSLRDAYIINNIIGDEYSYFKFTATGKDSNYNQMGEITLYTNVLDTVKGTMDKYDNTNVTITSYQNNTKIPDGDEGPAKLFDGTTAKHGIHDNFVIEFKTQSAIAISAIIFSHGNDSATSNRYYSKWTLEALDDKGTADTSDDEWVTVYDCAGGMERPDRNYDENKITDPDDLPNSLRVCYLIGEPAAYQSYRLTANRNGGEYNQMGEITFYTEKAN